MEAIPDEIWRGSVLLISPDPAQIQVHGPWPEIYYLLAIGYHPMRRLQPSPTSQTQSTNQSYVSTRLGPNPPYVNIFGLSGAPARFSASDRLSIWTSAWTLVYFCDKCELQTEKQPTGRLME